MRHTLVLDHDTCDQITVKSLKEAYRVNVNPSKIDHSDDEVWVDHEFLKAVDSVMEYFCNAEEMRQWNSEKEQLKDPGYNHGN